MRAARQLRPALRTALGCALGLLLAACEQPAPKCNVAHGQFWARYTLVSGEGDCAMLTGEELDVQSYFARRSSADDRPDYNRVSIAIQPISITTALGNASGAAVPNAEDEPYAIGRFTTSEPDRDGFCRAATLAEARLRLPAIPERELDMCTTAPATPQLDVRYAFENVRVYYTPAAIGTQFAADLTYTSNGCTARYRVEAVYPRVSCGAELSGGDAGAADSAANDAASPEDDGGTNPEPDAGMLADAGEPCPDPEPPAGPQVADDSLCENAGINPDFDVTCDPDALVCALATKPPSLK